VRDHTLLGVALALVLLACASAPGLAQDRSAGRVWGIGVQLIPATSFEVDGFSFPTMTISARYWAEERLGVEAAFTFGLKRSRTQTGSTRFDTTGQLRALYKFADTEETDFYVASGLVARVRDGAFSLPALRTDVGVEFNANPNRSTSWEIGYGFRLLGPGDFLDRITTGLGFGEHFYPTRLEAIPL